MRTKTGTLPDHVYHLAEATNWPSIQKAGLLSASQLIAQARLKGQPRALLEHSQRLEHTVLPNGIHIRDQKPMPPKALETCLKGMTPAEWYALINSRAFFWIDPDRLNRQRAACGAREQVVLTIDTAALVGRYKKRVALTPINTGNARRKPAVRGAATFVPLEQWLESGWRSEAQALGVTERKPSHQPVELTVRDGVADIMEYVVKVKPLKAGQEFTPAAR